MYDIFNNSLSHADINRYNDVCMGIITEDNSDKSLKMEFCMKLLRNLMSLSKVKITGMNTNDRCRNLNDWLFYQTEKLMIKENIISEIFDALNKLPNGLVNSNNCIYYYYNTNYIEPEKVIKLNNFIENIDSIKSTLEKRENTNYCLCQRYIYECINICREINKKYCNNEDDRKIRTCGRVSNFLSTYISYLPGGSQISNKIEYVTFTEKEYLGECAPNEEAEAVASDKVDNHVVGSVTGTLAGTCLSLLALYKVNIYIIYK